MDSNKIIIHYDNCNISGFSSDSRKSKFNDCSDSIDESDVNNEQGSNLTVHYDNNFP